MHYDVIITGAGPIGLACGIEAQNRGLSYLIIEKGCIVNSVFHYPANMTFFSTSEKIEIGGVPFVSHGIKPTRREALEYYRRVSESYKLNIHTFEKVLQARKTNGGFMVVTSKAVYDCSALVLATGYYDNPNMLGISGENLHKVSHYFDEPHPYSGLNAAVIGAGNSAADAALELFRVGAKVTMIVREKSLKPTIKYWVKPDIDNRIAEGSIQAFFNSTVDEITHQEIVISTPSGKMSVHNDAVFAMTGYHPDLDFLKDCGVRILKAKSAYFRKSNMETNVPGLYLAGVVCSGNDTDKYFIENSIVHAATVMRDVQKMLKSK